MGFTSNTTNSYIICGMDYYLRASSDGSCPIILVIFGYKENIDLPKFDNEHLADYFLFLQRSSESVT